MSHLFAHELATVEAWRAAQNAKKRGYCPHVPHPRQAQFLALDCKDALYGGAAGGGKSDALLMAALQYVHVPGYAAIILRRTFSDLSKADAIMTRAAEWLANTDARWSEKTHTWRFPSGATLAFGHFDHESVKDTYQGGAWQFVGIDELTQWPEAWARYLFSRIRKPTEGPLSKVPLRFRAATNPGGIGHEWVRRKYVGQVDGAGNVTSHEGCVAPFIPAKLEDNPSLDGDSYREGLAELDEQTRRQLELGLWVRDGNGLVYSFDETRNVIDEAPSGLNHILALDFGVTDACSFNVIGWRLQDPNVYVVESYKREKMAPSAAAEEALDLDRVYHFTRVVGDIGGLGKGFAEEMTSRYSIPVEAAEKQNKRGYISLLNGELERGRVRIVKGKTDELRKEWLELPWNEDRSKEVEGFENHCSDGTLYGWRAAPNYHERVPDARRKTEEQRIEEELAQHWERRENQEEEPWWNQ